MTDCQPGQLTQMASVKTEVFNNKSSHAERELSNSQSQDKQAKNQAWEMACHIISGTCISLYSLTESQTQQIKF